MLVSSPVVKLIASNIYMKILMCKITKSTVSIVFNELKNDISRNYLLSISVLAAVPETIR